MDGPNIASTHRKREPWSYRSGTLFQNLSVLK
jgi:hypothetical protein